MDCTNCGHSIAREMVFCLNCGTRVAAHFRGTSESAQELPDRRGAQSLNDPNEVHQRCGECGAKNARDMRFCRECGGALVAFASAPSNAVSPTAPTPPPGVSPPDSRITLVDKPMPEHRPPPKVQVRCGSCGAKNPSEFSYCQQCGTSLSPTEVTPTPRYGIPVPPSSGGAQNGDSPLARSRRPTPVGIIQRAWGVLTCLNRDGTNGEEYPLLDDFVEMGSGQGAHLRFEDPCLAPCHARFERLTGGGRIVPVDRLNGVFLKIREDTPICDGSLLLVGRELLRFERVQEHELSNSPLVQHGVCRFGSPVREAWGRLLQLMPDGGVGDVRHLYGVEVRLGREEGELLFADDEFLSRRHVSFRWQEPHCIVSDLGSSNGTFVRLREPANLSSGDVLRLGDQMFRYNPVDAYS